MKTSGRMRTSDPRIPRLASAFAKAFGRPVPFRSLEIGVLGFSDGTDGTQWNCWYNVESQKAFVGVNLEGIGYPGWPLAVLIRRELQRPLIFCVLDCVDAQRVEVRLWRDVWIAGRKHRSLGDTLPPTPLLVSNLSAAGWRRALLAARACTGGSRLLGFGRQDIVLRVSRKTIRGARVSPHLQFKTLLWETEPTTAAARAAAISRARRLLHPIHVFVRERSTGRG